MGVAIFTGVVAFAPSLVIFVVSAGELTLPLMLTWAVSFGLWMFGWSRPSARNVILPLAIAAFMTAIVVFPVPTGFTWPRLAGIGLALAVTAAAVSGLRLTLLWSALAVLLLVVDYLRDVPHAGHLSSSLLDAASTVLGLLVIPPAIAVVSQQWTQACEEGDAASERSREREARARGAERAEAARAAVDRRIHETVLNTLATIARARTSPEAAQAQCTEDLNALDSLESAPPRKVRELLNLLLERHPVPQPIASVVSEDMEFGDDDMATAAYVALGEVLRNVVRHSRASRTKIQVRAPVGRITFIISDDGVGMDEGARRRFGMRRALIEAVESSGGSVTVESGPSRGTTVTMSLPTSSARSPEPPASTSSIDVLLGPPSVRVAMAAPLAIGIALLVPTALVFTDSILVGVAYLIFATAVFFIALRWDSPRLAPLAWASLATMVVSQVVAWTGVEGCSSAGGLHQVLFTTAAAMLLPPLALRRLPAILIMVTLVIIPTLLIPWSLPSECRSEAFVPAFETSLWVIALVGIMVALSRAFDRSSVTLATRWHKIADADARRLAMQAADQRWRSVDLPTRSLLASIAEGTTSSSEPHVRSTAMRLEARIRSLLETSKIRSQELRACLEGVVEDVTAAGGAVVIIVVSDEAEGPVRAALPEQLTDIGLNAQRSGLHITVLDGELLVSADRAALDNAALGTLEETDDPDTAVAVLRWEAVPSST